MTEPQQIDLASTSAPPTMRELREAERERLAALSHLIEKAIADAKDPDHPLHKELSVRTGKRAVGGIVRKVKALEQITQPQPYHTAPTRERADKTEEAPMPAVVHEAGRAVAVNHRWQWPVEKAHRLHQLGPAKYMAASRVRKSFFDMGRPGTMHYSDDRRASDPSRRTLTTEDQQAANRMMSYVWPRLEDEFKTILWVLVLQQPLPGEDEPLSIVEFGRKISGSRTEEHARWFALGAMKAVLARLTTIVHHFDVAEQKAKDLRERAIERRA